MKKSVEITKVKEYRVFIDREDILKLAKVKATDKDVVVLVSGEPLGEAMIEVVWTREG